MTPIALAAVSALALGWNLGVRTLADFDEAIYAEVAREATRDHSLVILHFNFAPWYQKPPLLMWIQALLFEALGAGDAAARIPSLVAAIATVVLTFLIARRYLDWAPALLSSLVLIGCFQFVAAARFATTDMLLTFFVYLQVWAYLRVREGHRRAWYVVGVAAGLGIMTKGAAGLAGPLVLLVALAADRRLLPTLLDRDAWVAVGLLLVIAAPWHLLAFEYGGRAFLDDYVGYHLLRRAAQPIEGHEGNALTYFAYIRNQFFPWAYLALFAVPAYAYQWYRRRAVSAVLLATVLVILVLYTVVQTKLVWYILPVYPALAMMAAALLWRAALGGRLELALVALAGVLGALLIPHQLIDYPRVWAYGYLLLLVAAALLLLAFRFERAPVLIAGVTLAFFTAVSIERDIPLYRPDLPPVVAMARIARDPSHRPLGVLVNDPRVILDTPVWPDLLWYADRPLVTVHGTGLIPGVDDYLLARADVPGLTVVTTIGSLEFGRRSR